MEKIEGIDLKDLLDLATKAQFEERKASALNRVRLVLDGVDNARRNMINAEKTFQKAQETYQKGLNKLEQIQKGNWDILKDDKDNKEQS